MNIKKEEFLNILKKYRKGTASFEEIRFINTYFSAFELEDDYTDSLNKESQNFLEQRIKRQIDKKILIGRKINFYSDGFKWMKYAGVAVILLTISVTGYFYINRKTYNKKQYISIRQLNDSSNDKTTLRLADGRIILLEEVVNGELADQAGVRVQKQQDGQISYTLVENSISNDKEMLYNEITTSKGKQFKIILPDGSQVQLNTMSSLRYPTKFSKNERAVELSGEAYFEVVSNKDIPFKVRTGSSEVSVTGTRFNVESYAKDNQMKTTLLSGGVNVSSKTALLQLKPGEQAIIKRDGSSIKEKVDTDQVLAWRAGFFAFDDESLEQIMNKLSKWYDLTILLDPSIANTKISGRFSTKRKIEDILTYMQVFADFDYSIKHELVYINRKMKIEKR
jgi:transmembrane sensor